MGSCKNARRFSLLPLENNDHHHQHQHQEQQGQRAANAEQVARAVAGAQARVRRAMLDTAQTSTPLRPKLAVAFFCICS
jgi:hypothetical protein